MKSGKIFTIMSSLLVLLLFQVGIQEYEALAENENIQIAAQKGDAEAQYRLGTMHLRGQGIEKNEEQAVVWFQKAAEQGNVNAQYTLSQMYRTGRGVPKNTAKAKEWLQKAKDTWEADPNKTLAPFMRHQ